MHFVLTNSFGEPVPKEELYVPRYIQKCKTCSFKILCNSCSDCGGCHS